MGVNLAQTDPDGASAARVAIVGSGPAGFYAAAEVLRALPGATVNMFERLPTPWGLLRAGVAPDHENMRAVGAVFDRVAQKPGFTLFANVEVGSDITHAELMDHHHAVIYATGALRGRMPSVRGADLANSFTAGQFVGWYNGHPDFAGLSPDLTHERAIIIGNGNVALDVARMLTRSPEELGSTDISDHALAGLTSSRVKEVVILGRRGPAESGFTLPELVELEKLSGVQVELDLRDASLAPGSGEVTLTVERKNAVFARLLAGDVASDPPRKRILLKFFAQPTEFLGPEQVDSVVVTRTRLDADGRAKATEQQETIRAGLVVSAIGFDGDPIPGVPFDGDAGTIPSVHARVIDPSRQAIIPGVYVAGWIRRGPAGVIGENKRCGTEAAANLAADFSGGALLRSVADNASLKSLLAEHGNLVIDFAGWQRINHLEREAGAKSGRPRVKFVHRDDLFAAAFSAWW